MTRFRTRSPMVVQDLAVYLTLIGGLVWVLPGTWAEVRPSLPTGRRRGLSGRAALWRTSPPVSRPQTLSTGQGRWRRQPRRRTRARGTWRQPHLEERISLEPAG